MEMKRFVRTALAGVFAVNVAGCAGTLNSVQKSELRVYQEKGLLVEEKNPGLGAALGILPGGGSFYTRHIGLGVVNLLLWPLSILWDPMNGYDQSNAINYFATHTAVSRQKEKEIAALEADLSAKKITPDDFLIRKGAIERKYAAD